MVALNRRQIFAVSPAAAAIGLSNTSRSAPRVQVSAGVVITATGAAGLTVSRLPQRLPGAASC